MIGKSRRRDWTSRRNAISSTGVVVLMLLASCIPPTAKAYWMLSPHHLATSRRVVTTRLFTSSANDNNKNLLVLPSSSNNEPLIIRSVAAPMVGASDYAFRCLCRQHSGVDLTFTQMLHAKHLVAAAPNNFAACHLDLYEYQQQQQPPNDARLLLPSQQDFLQGADQLTTRPHWSSTMVQTTTTSHTTGPVIVQLAGDDPTLCLRAAENVLETNAAVAGFDLNCGCPQAIARRGNYGAFLMDGDNGRTVCEILRVLRDYLPRQVAVSAKIRLPNPNLQQPDHDLLRSRMLRLAETTGVDFLTIHGRTVLENKTAVRACHTDQIRKAVEIVRASSSRPGLPVIANGGVEFMPDVSQRLDETGASAIMSSEGLLETPNFFVVDSSQHSPKQLLEQQFQVTRDYLAWSYNFPPMPGVLGPWGCAGVVKGHVFKMLHRYWQEHADLRERLAKHKCKRAVQMWSLVEELYGRYENLHEDELADLSSSLPSSSWYRRHWKAASLLHQRGRSTASNILSVVERKELARQRIAKLRAQQKNIKLPVE